MLVITARIFKDNQLVGYQLSDGSQTQSLSKLDTWMYAKNKQIMNVVATGTAENPGLSGTNGFELKKLPEIRDTEKQQESKRVSNVTRNILIENGLYNPAIKSHPQFMTDIVGYKIRNIGTEPIKMFRLPSVKWISTTTIQLNPGETAYVSRVELADLAYREKDKFANGDAYAMHRFKVYKGECTFPTYDFFYQHFYFEIGEDHFLTEEARKKYHDTTPINSKKINIYDVLDEDTIKNYFLYTPNKNRKDITRNILVENALYNPAIQVPMRGFMTDWVGYKIKNIGTTPIKMQRITSTPDHSTEEIVLNPNEIIYVSRAELGNLASQSGTMFANGGFYFLSSRHKEIKEIKEKYGKISYDYLYKHFSFQGGEDHFLTEEARQMYKTDDCLVDTKINMYEVLDEATIQKYFIYRPNGTQQKPVVNNTEPLKKQSGAAQMFGMFKR